MDGDQSSVEQKKLTRVTHNYVPCSDQLGWKFLAKLVQQVKSLISYLESAERIIGSESHRIALLVIEALACAPERLQLVPFCQYRVPLITKDERTRDRSSYLGYSFSAWLWSSSCTCTIVNISIQSTSKLHKADHEVVSLVHCLAEYWATVY